MERFKNVDLHPDVIDNPTMGTIFEELIRKFNEALNENPGEHFTPRDVVHLMVLLLAGDEDRIRQKGVVLTVTPAAGQVECSRSPRSTSPWARGGMVILSAGPSIQRPRSTSSVRRSIPRPGQSASPISS
jgi:hypothetical protein